MDQNKHRKDGSLKSVSYAKWGYIFITPFFLVYIVFTLVPQFLTVYNSFFENYRVGLEQAQYSFSAAVGLFNSVINTILLVTVNTITKKLGETSLF